MKVFAILLDVGHGNVQLRVELLHNTEQGKWGWRSERSEITGRQPVSLHHHTTLVTYERDETPFVYKVTRDLLDQMVDGTLTSLGVTGETKNQMMAEIRRWSTNICFHVASKGYASSFEEVLLPPTAVQT